jgi:uncharacterized membrane-anchored protein
MSREETYQQLGQSSQPTAQEIVNKLEKAYIDATSHVAEVKTKHMQVLEQLIAAQDAQHTALKTLADTKISYIANMLQTEQSKSVPRQDNVKV